MKIFYKKSVVFLLYTFSSIYCCLNAHADLRRTAFNILGTPQITFTDGLITYLRPGAPWEERETFERIDDGQGFVKKFDYLQKITTHFSIMTSSGGTCGSIWFTRDANRIGFASATVKTWGASDLQNSWCADQGTFAAVLTNKTRGDTSVILPVVLGKPMLETIYGSEDWESHDEIEFSTISNFHDPQESSKEAQSAKATKTTKATKKVAKASKKS